MKKIARLALALAMTTGVTLTGTAAAQAAPTATPVVQSVAAVGSGDSSSSGGQSSKGLCPSCCATFKYLHYTAEMLVDTVGLQPVLSIIDKPIIHPLLWSPLDAIFGPCGGSSHPAELG